MPRQSAHEGYWLPKTPRFYLVECVECGFEPEWANDKPPQRCPRCGSHTFKTFVRPGATLGYVEHPPALKKTKMQGWRKLRAMGE